jgi:hypothetical protein
MSDLWENYLVEWQCKISKSDSLHYLMLEVLVTSEVSCLISLFSFYFMILLLAHYIASDGRKLGTKWMEVIVT